MQSDHKEFIVDQILQLSDTDQTQLMQLMEQLTVDKIKDDLPEEESSGDEITKLHDELAIAMAQIKMLEDKLDIQEEEMKELKENNIKHIENENELREKNRNLETELKKLMYQKNDTSERITEEYDQQISLLKMQILEKEKIIQNMDKSMLEYSSESKKMIQKLTVIYRDLYRMNYTVLKRN